jgi:hypothetical protein
MRANSSHDQFFAVNGVLLDKLLSIHLYVAECVNLFISYKSIGEIKLCLFLNSLVTCQYNSRRTLVRAETSKSCLKSLLHVFQLYMIGALME